MTYTDLLRRVYAARHELAKQGATAFDRWVVALHPWDLAHVKGGLDYPALNGRGEVLGMGLRPDATLRIGEVRLRVEVAA